MDCNQQVIQCIYSACDTLNKDLSLNEQIPKSPQTKLTGEGANIDSLNMINFILDIEANVEKVFGKKITLINNEFFLDQSKYLQNIETLSLYITGLLNKA